jgi:pyruvate/2-oxoglutarate dehydrogenase complex dihydrolipoamide acyltransferase (E2) component
MHRALVASLPARSTPPSLVALDGSYDFQTNRAEMGEKIAVFFRSKVGVPTTVVGLPETERPGADLAPTAFSATLAALDAANILFLGPGSPSRALFRWAGTPIVDRLVSRIHAGATLITSSAAAAASGESAIPVYEIYKAGLSAHWLTGLNLVGTLLGVRVAIVPHWNNAEGATHDTSRCFIGDVKLRELERALPAGVARFPTSGAPRAYEPAAAAAPSASAPPLPAAPSPRDLLAPAVERLITLRAAARAEKRFSDADAIRDAIMALGVELSDQADGVTWSMRA